MVSFAQVPNTVRVPFVTMEIDNSRATLGPALLAFKALLLSQKTSAGAQAANTIAKVTSEAQVIAAAGRGSLAHRAAKAWFANNTSTELWLGVVDDNAGGVAATGTLVFSGPATAAGTIALYIGGERITVNVASGDANTAIATAVAAAINANLDLPVTASPSTATVTVTHRHKGTSGNNLDMRFNYNDGEAFPAGVGCVVTAMASGATNPTLTTIIAALGDIWFNIMAFPWTDATSLTAIETELTSRWGAMRMIDCQGFTGAPGTFGTLSSLGSGRNSKHVTIVEAHAMPTPADEVAAVAAALVAFYGAADPGRPFQTLTMNRVLPAVESARFTFSERNLLLFDGITTTKVVGGVVQLERVITTYQLNSAGADDVSYLDVTTMLTLSYLRYTFRQRIMSIYPRHKLADDGIRPGAGQAIITPKIGKAEALAWFRQMEELALVENYDQFAQDLVCERNVSDRNRLDWLLSPDIINQLIVGASRLAYVL